MAFIPTIAHTHTKAHPLTFTAFTCRRRHTIAHTPMQRTHAPSRSGSLSLTMMTQSGGGGGQGSGGPPVDAPSGVLLGVSCVLAIASVGSIFELTGGHPTYGSGPTSAVLAVTLPAFLFLFYAAIRKGQQEAMDDP